MDGQLGGASVGGNTWLRQVSRPNLCSERPARYTSGPPNTSVDNIFGKASEDRSGYGTPKPLRILGVKSMTLVHGGAPQTAPRRSLPSAGLPARHSIRDVPHPRRPSLVPCLGAGGKDAKGAHKQRHQRGGAIGPKDEGGLEGGAQASGGHHAVVQEVLGLAIRQRSLPRPFLRPREVTTHVASDGRRPLDRRRDESADDSGPPKDRLWRRCPTSTRLLCREGAARAPNPNPKERCMGSVPKSGRGSR